MKNTQDNTPGHCWECHKFKTCEQAQHMTPDTEPVDGFIYEASTYCEEHAPEGAIEDHNPEVDSPMHCDVCGIPLKCDLTTDGVQYVREELGYGGGCCRELWPVLFESYLED